MNSILHRASRSDIIGSPFPHLVIRDALDSNLYDRLAREFPSPEVILNGRKPLNNKYYRLCARDSLAHEQVSQSWKDFIYLHTSTDFYREFVSLFGDCVKSLHPNLEAQVGKSLQDMQTNVRFKEEFRDTALECQFTYNSPVLAKSTSAVPHLDRESALYAGLLYFRLDYDDSSGGDLEFYRFVDAGDPNSKVECVKTMKYERNTLVFFLHSPVSIHGVSERSITTLPRLYVNFVAEFQFDVFDPGANPGPFEALVSPDSSESRELTVEPVLR